MHRVEPFEEILHRGRERLIGLVGAEEAGVAAAADLGDLGDVEHRAERRLGVAGHIRVPAFARDIARILVGLDRQDFGIALRLALLRRRVIGVLMQRAEITAEALVVLARQLLVAEDEHEMIGESLLHLGKLGLAERLRQIDALDLRADDRRQRIDADELVFALRLRARDPRVSPAGHDVLLIIAVALRNPLREG